MAVQIERTARMQLLAESAGEIQEIDADLAKEAHDWILQASRSRATFSYFARRILRQLPIDELSTLVRTTDTSAFAKAEQ